MTQTTKDNRQAEGFLRTLLAPGSVRAAVLWLITVAAVAVLAVMKLPSAAVSSDVLELLPEGNTDARASELADVAARGAADRVIWAVTGPEAARETLAAELVNQGLVTTLQGKMTPEAQAQWLTDLRAHVLAITPPATEKAITENTAKGQIRAIRRDLYSPVGGVTGPEWANDPWLLVRAALKAQQTGKLRLKDGWLTGTDSDGRTWTVLTGTVPPAALNGAGLKAWIAKEKALRGKLSADYQAEIVGQGVVYYSHHAASEAEHDMTTLGSASLVLLAAFLWLAYRSFRPVALCMLSVTVGALFGTVAVLTVFGSLHAVTLVMCLSLIGISADYTTYYVTRRFTQGAKESAVASLARLRPGLLHAILTTLAAYALMLFAPFPGLQQLALFAVAGLAAAWLTVVLWFPFMVGGCPVRELRAPKVLDALLAMLDRRGKGFVLFVTAFALFCAAGLSRVSVNDDLAALSTPPDELARQEKVLASLTGQGFSQTWFAVVGKTPAEAATYLDAFRPALQKHLDDGTFTKAMLMPLRSQETQQAILDGLRAADPALAALHPACAKNGTDCAPYQITDPDTWLAGQSGAPWRALVQRLPDGTAALFVPVTLAGTAESAAAADMLAATDPNVYWLSRRADFDRLFAAFRVKLTELVIGGFVATAVLLMALFGLKRGLAASLPVLGGLAAGCAAIGLTGMPLNLFSLFALVLVMGIGADYTVFFQSRSASSHEMFYTLGLALTTTLLSLGILVFSRTPAVSVFGLVLAAGVLGTFLLAPLPSAGKARTETDDKENAHE